MILLTISLSACAIGGNQKNDREAININLTQTPTTLPYKVEVLEELNDGKALFIRAKISNFENFQDINSLIRLSGLANGKLATEKYYLLQTSLNPTSQELLMEIPSAEISDYQLELLWGQDAKNYLSRIQAEIRSQLTLESVQVEKVKICEAEICRFNFKISGQIKNNGAETVPTADLGLSFQTEENLSAETKDLSMEKTIPIKDLNLSSQQSRSFNLEADSPAEDLRPHLRIKP